ncbi:MAG TPA: GAF domain-containing protein [Anaeromyxobacteraceae bacterium]|nr:GAF domain-containing protein [Anaeromyxobacteraceae bacterium]
MRDRVHRGLAPIRSWRIVGLYAVFASAWLLGSDIAVASFASGAREAAEWSFAKGMAFVLATSVVFYALLQRAAADIHRSRAALEESESRYRTLVENAPQGIVVIQAGVVEFANRCAQRLFKGEARELVGRSVLDFAVPEEAASVAERLAHVERGEPFEAVMLRRLRRLDGTFFRGEVEASRYEVRGRPAVQLEIRDVTAQTQAEESRRRLAWAMGLVRTVHEALVRAESEESLLSDICRAAVEVNGLRMAWVGRAEEDEARSIQPVTWRGVEGGYLSLRRPSWAGAGAGGEPAGRAVSSGQVVVVEDVQADPSLRPLAEEMRSRGYASAAFLPLSARGQRIGVLGLYAGEPSTFQPVQADLLQRLADDVASAIAALRNRRAREAAEAALRQRNDQLLTLATRLSKAREEERARIARDLHDELGQMLAGLSLDLRQMEDLAGAGSERGRMEDLVVAASVLADQAAAAVKRIATDLRPLVLDKIGLGAALAEEGRRFHDLTGLACEVNVPAGLDFVPPPVAAALYRIAQEALTNVMRHASASRVSVRLAREGEALVLHIEDDGRGPPPSSERGKGLGLVGMEERAAQVGGEVRFEPRPGGGSAVTARVSIGAGEGRWRES